MTTCGALLRRGIERLGSATAAGATDSDHGARLDAQLMLAHVLGIERSRFLSHPDTPCSEEDVRRYQALVERRAAGEPLAYLVGRREFWSLDLAVSPAVLVPRPETELLVERALTLGPRDAARVADLGTGSGAIALALATERAHWQVTATDISPAALAVARANAVRLGLSRIEFRLGDWFAALAGETFDLLLSNPPYVGAADPALAQLQHEPQVALTPGPDALASLRLLAATGRVHLAEDGWLLLEHGAEQGAQVRAALVLAGFRHVRSHPDLAGRERITEGQR